jgi:hypothetical protein
MILKNYKIIKIEQLNNPAISSVNNLIQAINLATFRHSGDSRTP